MRKPTHYPKVRSNNMELIGGILGGMFTMLALYVLIFLIGSTLHKTPDDLGGFDDLNKTTQDGER